MKSSRKINNIVRHLTQQERTEFLEELLCAIDKHDDLIEIISAWEATAEINAIPNLRDKILERNNKLQKVLLKIKHA